MCIYLGVMATGRTAFPISSPSVNIVTASGFTPATPIFTSTTISTSPPQIALFPRSNYRVPSQKGRKLFKNPICVAAPPSNPTTTISDEDQEKLDPLIEPEDSDETSSSKFSWRDHWYPVSLVEDLDPRYPTPFQLLNRDLVLWFDGSASKWVAFDDKCPHRLAPLSEGRIDENGHLQCSYHGWSFDGCGSCTRIPQAASEGPEARALKSPRACATRFPTMVSQGLLFVWPDENGWERAQAIMPPMYKVHANLWLPDDFDKPEFSSVTIQRDLYYGYDTLMENVSDPSHIDFAHHKVTGEEIEQSPCPSKWNQQDLGVLLVQMMAIQKSVLMTRILLDNIRIEIDTKLPVVGDQKWVIWICSFNVPMAPGKTRSIVCSARNFFQFTMPGPAWWQVVPRWHEHWTSNKVYDGDMIVLQGQEKVFLSQTKDGSGDVNKQYTQITFTPTQADRFVLAFRNWLRRHGNSQPQWFGNTDQQPLPSTVLSKRQMLDRFEQHTLKCSSCRNAYTTFQTLQKFLVGAAVVCAATAGIPPDMQLRIVFGAVAILSAGLAYGLNELQKNFVFVDYVHADID
ncbi:hypothetical protein DH2020_020756 [Rehmannia glutinosa]|uniref:Rieske domain-containing protein n=1 Tax=Rehmannia glutinosa TaxID=99300 RepID=A0ABR0W4Q8_REHGL